MNKPRPSLRRRLQSLRLRPLSFRPHLMKYQNASNRKRPARPSRSPHRQARFSKAFLKLTLLAVAWLLMPPSHANADPAKNIPVRVELRHTDGGYELLRGGQPFFIKGVGGNGSKELLQKCGGN